MPALGRTDDEILAACQATIGYSFRNVELLRAALTHSSRANTRTASNERMEFLGDAVLGLVTCDELYRAYPDYMEGNLTKAKSVIVSRKVCAEISRRLELGQFLFSTGLGGGAELPSNVLADLIEALIGAVYLDGGWEAARAFIRPLIAGEITQSGDHVLNANAKSEWQTVSQKEFGGTPRYYVLDEQGPDHDKCFKVAADVNGHRFPPAWGRNKKEAEIKAALNALAVYENQDVPFPC
jgi:ribonuclease-3